MTIHPTSRFVACLLIGGGGLRSLNLRDEDKFEGSSRGNPGKTAFDGAAVRSLADLGGPCQPLACSGTTG
jgi:hypothetical protein